MLWSINIPHTATSLSSKLSLLGITQYLLLKYLIIIISLVVLGDDDMSKLSTINRCLSHLNLLKIKQSPSCSVDVGEENVLSFLHFAALVKHTFSNPKKIITNDWVVLGPSAAPHSTFGHMWCDWDTYSCGQALCTTQPLVYLVCHGLITLFTSKYINWCLNNWKTKLGLHCVWTATIGKAYQVLKMVFQICLNSSRSGLRLYFV